eukprot:Blabericola_migrator_1__10739@NODE_614_length_7277_cov_53_523024_g447_i0_p3_GENE_NODE_614_length_7277_cov_53_523024_g447_i0NODE_614_length_7277_cov_53_523024_g447_i0_p3_ORF_typecomplete_len497_score89_16FAD_binding_4/PF01565_23/6_1e31BBE/PF08031_12/2_3e11Cytokinbind/PF09265_10/0_024ALO/PF04030_14/0_14_NODE_614_length_7277_cov_53_523024_g447_i0371527
MIRVLACLGPALVFAQLDLKDCVVKKLEDRKIDFDFPWVTEGEQYEEGRLPWNIQNVFDPLVITAPRSEAQISAVLKCAKEQNIQIAPLSGGHSYEGLGTGGRNGAIVVNLREFKNLTIHNETQIPEVDVGPGMRIGNLYLQLYENGGLWFPPGLCPTLGVAGFLLGGGIGFWSRFWGLGSDNIDAFRVCLTSGSCVTANMTDYNDLFWALRGAGGGNFGVVTSFRLRLRPAPEKMFVGIYKWTSVEEAEEAVCQVIQHYNDLPRSMAWEVIMYHNRCELWLTSVGEEEDEEVWRKIKKTLPPASLQSETDMDFMDAYLNVSDRLSQNPSKQDLRDPQVPKRYAKKRSLVFADEDLPLSRDLCHQIAQHVATGPPTGITHFELMGGAVGDFGPRDSSFWHRDMQLVISFTIVDTERIGEKDLQWLEDGYKLIFPHSSEGRSYINYLNLNMISDLPQPHPWYVRYYGENWAKLREVRLKYDPEGVFRAPLSIASIDE